MLTIGNIDKFTAARKKELTESRVADLTFMAEWLEKLKWEKDPKRHALILGIVKTTGESAKQTKEIIDRIDREGLTPIELRVEKMLDAVGRHMRGEWTEEERTKFEEWKLKKLEAEGKLYVRDK